MEQIMAYRMRWQKEKQSDLDRAAIASKRSLSGKEN